MSSRHSSSQQAFSAASRWLSRRAKQGVFDVEADSVAVLERHQTPVSSNKSSTTTSSSSKITKSLPSAILHQNTNNNRTVLLQSSKIMPSLLNNSSLLMRNNLQQQQQKTNSDRHFQISVSQTLQKYISLTTKLLSSSPLFWDEAVSCFIAAVSLPKTAANAEDRENYDQFVKFAKRSSPVWAALWIDSCSNELFVPVSSKTSSNSKASSSSSLEERQKLLLCVENVAKSILPLCNLEIREQVKSSCLDVIEREKQKLIHQSKQLMSVFERQLENQQWGSALRNFLLQRERFLSITSSVNSNKNNNNNRERNLDIQNAAVYSFDQMLAVFYRMNTKFESSKFLLADQVQSMNTTQINKQQTTLNKNLESSFKKWLNSRQDLDLQLKLVEQYCLKNLKPASVHKISPMSADLMSLVSTSTSTVRSSPVDNVSSPLTSCRTLETFLDTVLAPQTSSIDSSKSLAEVNSNDAHEDKNNNEDHQKLQKLLPTLSTIASFLGKAKNSNSFNKIAAILGGKSHLYQRENENSRHHHPVIENEMERICLIALALQIGCSTDEIAENLFSSSVNFTSHWGGIVMMRAKRLATALPPLVENENNIDAKIHNLANVLQLPQLALKEVSEHLSEQTDKRQFIKRHSSLIFSSKESLSYFLANSSTENYKDNLEPWKLALESLQTSSMTKGGNGDAKATTEKRSLLVSSLLQTGQWRAAIAIADARHVSSLCHQILVTSSMSARSSSSSSSSSSQWELAVGMLSELSKRNLRLKPNTLMSVLKILDTPSAPEEISVNLTIQMGLYNNNDDEKRVPSSSTAAEHSDNEQSTVVNLLVSVTRAVMRQKQMDASHESSSMKKRIGQKLDSLSDSDENMNSNSNSDEEGHDDDNDQLLQSSSLLRARVHILANLFSSASSSSTAMKRKQASSLRSALILCADANDWQSALYLVSTASDKMPEFRLSPDVVWKITKALEHSQQHARVDLLKDYIAGKDVADWLQSEDDNLLLEKRSPSTYYTTSSRNSKDNNNNNNSTDDNALNQSSSPLLINGTLVSDFIKVRCNAIHRAAAIGKWKVATTLFADVIEANRRVVVSEFDSSAVSVSSSSSTSIGKELMTPIERALSSAVKVCALRRHWIDALNAMNSFGSLKRSLTMKQGHPSHVIHPKLSDQVSVSLIRCLSVYGRWFEATSLFSQHHHKKNSNENDHDDNERKQKQLISLFTYLSRACRISSSWMAALHLHSSRPSLVSFSSVSEVVGACSACGFPLTKIQMWLNLSKSSLFLVSASLKKSSNQDDNDENLEDIVRSPDLSAVDLNVFFALLNAQSYYTFDSKKERTKSISSSSSSDFGSPSLAWIRSLQLLQACWMTQNNNTNNSSSSTSSRQLSYFSAAREPECVTSVIDTCVKQGKWVEAFKVYRMQRMLRVPVTSYAVYILLTSILEQQQQQRKLEPNYHQNHTHNNQWFSASKLLLDAMNSSNNNNSTTTASIIAKPLVCEKYIQILNTDGRWFDALNIASSLSLTKTVILSNDRVLDSFVKFAENSEVIVKCAMNSGTFPVSPHHVLGRRVESAIAEMLTIQFDDEQQQQQLLLLPIKALKKCLKTRDVSESILAAANLRILRLGGCSSSDTNSPEFFSGSSSSRISDDVINEILQHKRLENWIDLVRAKLDEGMMNAIQAVDLAFALCLLAHVSGDNNDNESSINNLKSQSADLLRFSMLFGIPKKEDLTEHWPKRISEIIGNNGIVEKDQVREYFKEISEEF